MSSTTRALATAALAALAVAAPAQARTAPGQVFAPNPVADLGIQTLTDQKDTDYFSALYPQAYHRVTLTDLDASGTLTGAYAKVLSVTGKAAVDTGGGFVYTRDQDQFEQTMAYYWVTQAQHYIQSLGLRNVNNRQQGLRINQFGGDNSFYRNGTNKLEITLGKGGVDDAEDAEVIIHEYGHSVQDDQVPGFGSTLEAGSIGEGFGDYLAGTVSAHFAPTADEACVADWDSTSYTSTVPHCLRRLDEPKVFPRDVVGEVHADGEIWSASLWAFRGAVGAATADRAIIQAQFAFTPGITMRDAARTTIATARALFGAGTEAAARRAFAAHGLA
jgi:fungalysin metallopeptidase (M36)